MSSIGSVIRLYYKHDPNQPEDDQYKPGDKLTVSGWGGWSNDQGWVSPRCFIDLICLSSNASYAEYRVLDVRPRNDEEE